MSLALSKVSIRGVAITTVTPREIVDGLLRHLQTGDRIPQTLAAINVHTLVEAYRNPEYRTALNDASIPWVDGVPIRWILRASGAVPPPRIHGADLMTLLLEQLRGARHLFYGSTPETLNLLRTSLASRYPDLKTCGFISPPFRKQAVRESDDVIATLNASGADVLWVALGAPKQEQWARLNRAKLRIPIVACVGAAFEIHAGLFNRAPRSIQKLGLEWAWRLAQDPARLWRRYFSTNGYFLSVLLSEFSKRLFLPAPREPSTPGS
jgi:N-acetylglucosaminyldiphosphoundecaprenol N-acetyl-beta-D-mannosaminyltransferase